MSPSAQSLSFMLVYCVVLYLGAVSNIFDLCIGSIKRRQLPPIELPVFPLRCTSILWDSQGCVSGSTFCTRGGPWFTTTLSQEVSDDIEVRWCFGEGTDHEEDVDQEQLKIYVY